MRAGRALTTCLLCLAGSLALPACAALQHAPKSTRLTDADMEDLAKDLGARLAQSDWLKERDATSDPIVVTWDKMENLSSDILTRGEQWAFASRVRSAAAIVELSRARALRVVIPAEFLSEGNSRGAFEEGFAQGRAPSHRMEATLRSATRAAQLDRTDAYLCDFRVTRLSDGSLAWSDTLSIKRAAVGRSFD